MKERSLRIHGFTTLMILVLMSAGLLTAQGRQYEGPDDPAGDIAAEREGYMTGNRVFLYFRNTTELSDWPKANVSRWPNTYDGGKMTDGVALLIGARVFLEQDSVPVTDPTQILLKDLRGELDTLYYLQTSYREEMDRNNNGDVEWGLYPVFGYFDETSEYPAMSNKPGSWPPLGWPAADYTTKWAGEWNGRFGKGVIYADLETYFVANDAQDLEYLGPEDQVKYYPMGPDGKKIGDIRPNVTIQGGKPWGGIGVRVETRGFQWNNPQARDAIFFEYNIANVSKYDLPDVGFGYWVDNAIGGADGDDELGYFDSKLDMAYSWDVNGVGIGGVVTGTMGFAYLESPGLGYDNLDNDEDGILNELRNNEATTLVGPTDGYTDLQAFLDFYKLKEEDLREHWDADEDQDWEDGEDLNGNGIYDSNEYAGDDLGLDGVGPGETNYTGPDEGECNHRPDYRDGVGCEPNFAATDVSESDMVGLTSFRLFPVPSHSSDHWWFRGDRSMWELVGEQFREEYSGNISNLIEVFASGPFPLYQGLTERISMSMLHSYDALAGLNSEDHSAPVLYELKKIVQVIYEKDYRFAQPPKMPTLQATAGDGKVILTWDDVADTRTRDPFVGNVNDFEGYKVYRATDKLMSDSQVITDGYGTPMFYKPIFQCDLKDTISGFTDFGLVNGMGYNLGYESGITHHFTDNTVENGRTYYYAVVAYDYGAPNVGPGIAPSENNVVIELNEAEDVSAVGKNVAIVTPRQDAVGYVPPQVELLEGETLGTGSLIPEILAQGSLKPGEIYDVHFLIDTVKYLKDIDHAALYTTSGFEVYRRSDTALVYTENPKKYSGENIQIYDSLLTYYYLNPDETVVSDVFEGLNIKIEQDLVNAYYHSSEWVTGTSSMHFVSTADAGYMPWDYEIVFTDDPNAHVSTLTNTFGVKDETGKVIFGGIIKNVSFPFYVQNISFRDSTGNFPRLELLARDKNGNGTFEILEDQILVGPLNTKGLWAMTAFSIDFQFVSDESGLPQDGDVYRITFKRPFYKTDMVSFRILENSDTDEDAIIDNMDNLRVVPNPYIATNTMETAVSNPFLNQRRVLMFTHLPASCEINIFTSSGVFVDRITVNNAADNGIIHWDLQTFEGLEIAAGMYIYHVKSTLTGAETIGKFAVIK